MRRTIVHFVGIELLALLFVVVQLRHGLATDEAKYLLSIPYPHPPVLRGFFHLLSPWSLQEAVVRILLSSVLCQSVWFLVPLTQGVSNNRRKLLILAWLLSPALLLQSGTIMLIVPCAILGLFLVCRALHNRNLSPLEVPLLSIIWILSLFSVYQTVLLTPLVLHLLRRSPLDRWKVYVLTFVPVIFLGFYTIGHPLILATFFKVSVQDNALPFVARCTQILTTIILSTGILTIPGFIGIALSRHRALQGTILLIVAYIILTAQQYYAILLTPLCIGGLIPWFHRRSLRISFFIGAHVVTSALLVWWMFPSMNMAPSRLVMQELLRVQTYGMVIIDGPFGHDWQYEAKKLSIRSFHDELSKDVEHQASYFICTKKDCSEDIDDQLWQKDRDIAGVGVWRRQ